METLTTSKLCRTALPAVNLEGAQWRVCLTLVVITLCNNGERRGKNLQCHRDIDTHICARSAIYDDYRVIPKTNAWATAQ